jgi:arginine deiminase
LDDIVELKSIKQCIQEGILSKDFKDIMKKRESYTMKHNIQCHPEMAECFGKVLYVHQRLTNCLIEEGDFLRVCLMTPDNDTCWYWPLEIVKR